MLARRRLQARRSRNVLLVMVFVFLSIQIASTVAMERWRPELYDPFFTRRLETLNARRAEMPNRPLLLVTGSSRLVMSFEPELLHPLQTPAGRPVLPFNFAHLGCGPIMELLHVQRLLDRGIRPDWLVVEVMPSFLAREPNTYLKSIVGARDLPLVGRYVNPVSLVARYAWDRLLADRRYLEDVVARPLEDRPPADESDPYDILPLGGCPTVPGYVTADDYQYRLQVARVMYYDALHNFHVSTTADRALHDLLDLCRREQVPVILLLTPEGSTMRSWYPPGAREQVGQYVAALGHDYRVPVVDARDWLADDDFYDSHHVIVRGAHRFTRRLESDVLQPLVEGKLHAAP